MSIAAAYYAGKVLRWHANPAVSVVRQTNSDHVAGCLTILFKLVPEPSINLVRAIVFHDIGEKKAGDLPSDFKKANPSVADAHCDAEYEYARRFAGCDFIVGLSAEEIDLINLVDKLEAYAHVATFCPQELEHVDWYRAIERLLGLSHELGLNKQVSTFIGDMRMRRFDLPEAC